MDRNFQFTHVHNDAFNIPKYVNPLNVRNQIIIEGKSLSIRFTKEGRGHMVKYAVYTDTEGTVLANSYAFSFGVLCPQYTGLQTGRFIPLVLAEEVSLFRMPEVIAMTRATVDIGLVLDIHLMESHANQVHQPFFNLPYQMRDQQLVNGPPIQGNLWNLQNAEFMLPQEVVNQIDVVLQGTADNHIPAELVEELLDSEEVLQQRQDVDPLEHFQAQY